MKRNLMTAVAVVFLVGLVRRSYVQFIGPGDALACSRGQGGGADYIPKEPNDKRSTLGALFEKLTGRSNAYASPSMTKEQVHDIAKNHVNSLNSSLKDFGIIVSEGIQTLSPWIFPCLCLSRRSRHLDRIPSHMIFFNKLILIPGYLTFMNRFSW